MTPLVKMHTLGHDFVPERIHAGGLRYHGMAPLVSHLYAQGAVEAEAIGQLEDADYPQDYPEDKVREALERIPAVAD